MTVFEALMITVAFVFVNTILSQSDHFKSEPLIEC